MISVIAKGAKIAKAAKRGLGSRGGVLSGVELVRSRLCPLRFAAALFPVSIFRVFSSTSQVSISPPNPLGDFGGLGGDWDRYRAPRRLPRP